MRRFIGVLARLDLIEGASSEARPMNTDSLEFPRFSFTGLRVDAREKFERKTLFPLLTYENYFRFPIGFEARS